MTKGQAPIKKITTDIAIALQPQNHMRKDSITSLNTHTQHTHTFLNDQVMRKEAVASHIDVW